MGVNLALDDFGTGYSSLTYLRSFPINIIKVDRSFVRTIGSDHDDTAIVAGVISLAHNLSVRVVAEGVESHEQLATLVMLHCDFLQGYLFSAPVPAASIGLLLDGPTLGRKREIAQAS
jgi:EAL domain-containing protein (putative c-di-GMP-specific phosphodiesterase class I)